MFLSFLLHKTNMKLFRFTHLLQLSIVSATLSAFGRLFECKTTRLDLTMFTDRSRVRSTASHWGKLYSVSMDNSYTGQCMHQNWGCMWHRTKYSHWPVKNHSQVTGHWKLKTVIHSLFDSMCKGVNQLWPLEVFTLTNLTTLDLSSNTFSTALPTQVINLINLQSL